MLFWRISFASKLYPQRKLAKNVQPLHWSSTMRHPSSGSYKASHLNNTVTCDSDWNFQPRHRHANGTARDVIVIVITNQDSTSSRLLPGSSYSFGNIVSRGCKTRRSDTLALALVYYSTSSSCRHISHLCLAPSDGRTAVFGEFCLMYTSFSARSMLKRLRALL
jgi:hypothetical protein